MKTTNLERASHRSIPHSSNLRREYHVPEDEVHVRGNFTPPNGFQHGSANRGHIHFDENMIAMHKIFRTKIDSLSFVQMCHIFQESYPRIHVLRHSEGPICRRCKSERGAHHFCRYNNMDLGEKPHILRVLTQVEEMLIARLNHILQVIHDRGGKYKYIGHTIIFPQDISTIVQSLPRYVEDIDFLIMRRHVTQSKYYECYVKISRVMASLLFKIQHDQYYRDDVIDYDLDSSISLSTNLSLEETFVDISGRASCNKS